MLLYDYDHSGCSHGQGLRDLGVTQRMRSGLRVTLTDGRNLLTDVLTRSRFDLGNRQYNKFECPCVVLVVLSDSEGASTWKRIEPLRSSP